METPKQSIFKRPIVQSIAGIIAILLIAAGFIVYKTLSSRVSIDDSLISAPVISIGPESPGTLDEVDVRAGDTVTAGQVLGRVGADVLSAQIPGIVVAVTNTPGQVFQPGQAVVQMIDPTQLRVVGTIKENEGLEKIAVGDPVSFTVDAFGSNKYVGVVDSINPNANSTGVAFTISDERPVQEFDINVKYDVAAHPEFKNGMSAKMKVFQKK